MKRSKRIFLLVAVIFIAATIVASVHISSLTTFPGSKPNLKERILSNDQDTTASPAED